MNFERVSFIVIAIPFVVLFVWGWTPFLISCGILLALFVLFMIGFNIYENIWGTPKRERQLAEIRDNCKQQEEEVIDKHKKIIMELDEKYGKCTKCIDFDWASYYYNGGGTYYNCFRVYNEASIVVSDFGKNVIKYSDILKVSVSDSYEPNNIPISSITKSNDKNVIGRAAAGYVIAGGVGAVIGGVTANKETAFKYSNNSKHDYTIIINTKDLSNPIVKIHTGEDLKATQEIEALLIAILNM